MKNCQGLREAAFTLIELLVVIAIIGILASLLLPSIGRSKEESKVTVCLNNLHQIDLSIEAYTSDTGGRYPGALGGQKQAREYVCPRISDEDIMKEMVNRPLYPYLKTSEVFACPEDKGEDFSPDYVNFKPSMWHAFGCSYSLNNSTWKYTKHVPQGTLAGQTSAWVKEPNRYIMLYEAPARPVWKIIGNICHGGFVEFRYYFHWHFSRGRTTVLETQLQADPQRFISPVLFVDGHAAKHDFTKALKTEPTYPIEETKDWLWYQYRPEDGRPAGGLAALP